MPLIYVKLGDGQISYKDERLNLNLEDGINPASTLDYLNLNEDVINALNNGVLVQITEGEFYGIAASNTDPISVPTSYLPSLTKFLSYPFNSSTLFFSYYNGEWYKVLWSEILKHFGFRVAFRVGDPSLVPGVGENYPLDGDTLFTLNILKGRQWEDLTITLNGIEIYNYNLHSEENQTLLDNWNIDPESGEFNKLLPFNQGDIIAIIGK